MTKTKLLIKHRWALGDTVLLTALIRDIHRAYPGKYEIKVSTNFTNVWWNNPYITDFAEAKAPPPLKIEVGWEDAIKWNAYAKYGNNREMKHILAWYHYDFERKTGLKVPVTDPQPDLHLSQDEKQRRLLGRYWVVISGGKLDLTTKHWHVHRMQEVVDKLALKGIECVQAGAVCTNHIHPPLENVTNLIGKTENVRDLWNLILHADGVICGVTGAMHIAAAFNKPCVVHAGGREEPWFEAYVDNFQAFGPSASPVKVPHKFLHTIGLLDCCDKQGCWKKRTVPLDPQDLTKKSYTMCRQPVRPASSHPVAKCQDLITSNHIVEAVMEYYDENVLPPIRLDKASEIKNPDFKTEKTSKIYIPQVELIEVRGDDIKSSAVASPKMPQRELLRKPSVEVKDQKVFQQSHPKEIANVKSAPVKRKFAFMDNDIIGGKFTAFVLCYGPYTELARKCITSLCATVPPDRLDLRVATNDVPEATLDFLKSMPITKIYRNTENRHKYPVMRDMFWDQKNPITTNYLLWFDDDTWIVQPNWIDDLCMNIVNYHHYDFRMYGNIMYHDLKPYNKNGNNPKDWFKEASWHTGKDLRVRGNAHEAANGSVIDFAVGWCWALEVAAMRKANIPDVRLGHNGGDITIGEQLHQAGYQIKQWNRGKKLVACPSRQQGGRRGYSERFPWDPDR
jgi:ADP-heptose:LPS heptosyltransferase